MNFLRINKINSRVGRDVSDVLPQLWSVLELIGVDEQETAHGVDDHDPTDETRKDSEQSER